MSEKSEDTVIGSLPHSRPQRRSAKRGARPEQEPATSETPRAKREARGAKREARGAKREARGAKREARGATHRADEPAPSPQSGEPAPSPQADEPASHRDCRAPLSDPAELAATVVRAAAELAEIGLTLGVRALRTAVSRLPRP